MTETPKTFDTLPEVYGSKIESQFAGLDHEVLKEMITFVKSELKEMGNRVGKTPDTANVLKMLDVFMQRLASNDELKKGGLKIWLTNKLFQVIDLVVQASDPQFANEYPIMLKNMTETGDAATAAKLLVRVVGASAYVGKQEDETLSGRAGRQLYENYEASLIDDLIDRKKELKKSGAWTRADDLELSTKDGTVVSAPVGEKVLKVYIKKDPAEEAGLYEQIATDVVVPQTGERPQNCANCGASASKNPYRGNCEYCGAASLQKTHERKISERLIKRKEAVKPKPIPDVKSVFQPAPKEMIVGSADFVINDATEVEVDSGPYKDVSISDCTEVTFDETAVSGKVNISDCTDISFRQAIINGNLNISEVTDVDGDLTISNRTNIVISDARDCTLTITRITDGTTSPEGSLTFSSTTELNLTGTHKDIRISDATDVHFDGVVVFGSVFISDATDITGEIIFVGNGQLRTSDCNAVKVKTIRR